jgi:glucose/arabinose dehydrogenase
MFPDYVGDMLLGTLRGQALIRLSTDDSGVITETRLPLGERIRDLSVLGSGHIVALTDSSRILILSGNE